MSDNSSDTVERIWLFILGYFIVGPALILAVALIVWLVR